MRDIERFESKTMPIPITGCWIWMGGRNPRGYGIACHNHTKNGLAHRRSWELYKGPIPEGMQVGHKCNVYACVNPEHLFLAPHLKIHRHHSRVKGPPQRKLTEAQVFEILTTSGSNLILAIKYKVSKSTISHIRTRRNWKYLTELADA